MWEEFHKYQNYMTDEDWVRLIRFWKSREGIQISEAEKYINPPPLDIWWQRLSVFATTILQYRLSGPLQEMVSGKNQKFLIKIQNNFETL